MKALVADFNATKGRWGRLTATLFGRKAENHSVAIALRDVPEATLPTQRWVKIRTIMSAISDIDEGLFLCGNIGMLGGYLSFPFIPGNENLGIITEIGDEVEGIEAGERVVVDPVLACKAREITPPCPSCERGMPSTCANFAAGVVGPGRFIGACAHTRGGWGTVFVAHSQQVRTVPQSMESHRALLVPEFTRALRGLLSHPPKPGSRVIILGARSLGLLTLLALTILGYYAQVLVVAEHPHEAQFARRLGADPVILWGDPVSLCEQVAEFSNGVVYNSGRGKIALRGGADLVYETTGTCKGMGEAMQYAGEGKDVVLLGMNQSVAIDLTPLWHKGIKVYGTSFSGTESYQGEKKETIDLALDLIAEAPASICEVVTHTYPLHESEEAWKVLRDRCSSKAIKVAFSHVM